MQTYRSDVVGSLLWPEYLKETRARYEAGRVVPQSSSESRTALRLVVETAREVWDG